MSIASQIQRIKQNIANAYTKCNAKGITLPSDQNSDNLATTIDKISTISEKEQFKLDVYKHGKSRDIAEVIITSNITEIDISHLGIDNNYIEKASNSRWFRNHFTIILFQSIDYKYSYQLSLNINETSINIDSKNILISLNLNTQKITIDTSNATTEYRIVKITFDYPNSCYPFKLSDFFDEGDINVPDYFNAKNNRLDATAVASITDKLPNTIKIIGKYAFSNDTSYTKPTSGQTTLPENLQLIKEYAFYCNSSIFYETLPNSLEIIENNAFYCNGDTNLKISNFGNSLKRIGDYAFVNRKGISATSLPNTLISIGIAAFNGCSGLKIDKIPNKITNIFTDCFLASGIEVLDMPKITCIQSRAFSNCSLLCEVRIGDEYLGEETLTIANNAFSYDSNLLRIYINLPRVTVETIAGYDVKWGATNATIICNDDENWVSANEDN